MHEVAVIGSGLNGLAVTYSLGVQGVDVTIFEEKTFGGNFEKDLRTSFISHQSLNLFKAFSADIIANAGNMKNIYSFKNAHSSVVELGDGKQSMGYVVDNSFLKELMIKEIRKLSNITIAENTPVENISNHNNGVAINGKNFNIAICASGANSSVHKLLGLAQTVKSYNQHALVFDIHHERHHQNIALEIFDDCGVIALLPKLDGNTSSVILSLKNELVEKLPNKKVLEFLQAKTQRARHIGTITEIPTPISQYPLAIKYMKHQLHGNIFFLGDSFHTIHPVLGQGFNMSLKDTAKLCNKIIETKKLGIPLQQCLETLPVSNVINHTTMGIATHVFGKAFVSNRRISKFLTTASICMGELIPTNIKTKVLQKML